MAEKTSTALRTINTFLAVRSCALNKAVLMPNQYCIVYFLQQIQGYRSSVRRTRSHQEISVQTNLGYHQQGKNWIDCGVSHFVVEMSGQGEYSCSLWKGGRRNQ